MCNLEGIPGGDRAVFDMVLLAEVDGHQVETGVVAATPGPGEAVRGFETGIVARKKEPGLSIRLHASRNQGIPAAQGVSFAATKVW